MSSSEDTTPAIAVPATPVVNSNIPFNVVESRDKRQQRTQSRVRDRGGIFKPTQRNTLLDILLGKSKKPSPVKSRRSRSRSVSSSPARRKSGAAVETTEDEGVLDTVSKPPRPSKGRKSIRKSMRLASEEPVAGPSSPIAAISQKAPKTRKGRKKTALDSTDENTTKAEPKTRGRKPSTKGKEKEKATDAPTPNVPDDDNTSAADLPNPKNAKSTTRSRKSTSKSTSTKKRTTSKSKAKDSRNETEDEGEPAVEHSSRGSKSASSSRSKKAAPAPVEAPPKSKADSRWQLEAIVEEDEEEREEVTAAEETEKDAAAATSAKPKGKAKASRARQTEATGKGKKGARKKAVENGSDDDDEPLPKARQKHSTAVKFKATAGELSDREEGDKEEEPEVVSRGRGNKKSSRKPKGKPQPTADHLENAPSNDRQARRGAASSSRSGQSRAENSGLDHDPDVAGESEKGERKGKAVVAKGKGRKVIESEAEDDPEPDTLTGNASALRKEENRHKPSVTEDGIASNDGELSTEIAKKASAAEGNKADTGSKKSKTTKAGTQSALHMDFSTMKPTKRRRDDAEQLVITKRPKINHESQAEGIVEKEESTDKPKVSKTLKVVPEKSTAADSPASKKRRRVEVSESDSGAASRNETTVPENQVEETVEEPVKKRSRTGKGSKSRKGPDAGATPTEDKTKPSAKPRKRKENTTSKATRSTTSTKSASKSKPSKSKGPPKSILDQIRKTANVQLAVDDEPDEIDFLS